MFITSHPALVSGGTASCAETLPKGYYVRNAVERDVVGSISPLRIIKDTFKKKMECANECLMEPECRSFTWEFALLMCKLYDANYSEDLTVNPTAIYYIEAQ